MLRRFSRAPSEIPVGLRLLIHQRFSEFLDALRAEGVHRLFLAMERKRVRLGH